MKLKSLLIFLFLTQFAFGQNKAEKLDSLFSKLFANDQICGNMLIAEKGKILYKKSFGNANESTHKKLDENSIFELASVSKQFTAMAIVILKEKGSLSFDDPISKYLPELKNYGNITIRNLLNHTSGLPDYMEVMDTTFDKSKIATNNDIISTFAKHQPPVLFEPNTKWEYSNTGYALLASIIERVSGLSYEKYLQQMIFKPLKMKNTFVYRRRFAPKKVKNYALGYVYSDSLKKYVLPDELLDMNFVIWLDGIVGDGTVNSTLTDLLKWDRALYSDKLISNESRKEVFTSSALNDKTLTDYGFGWFVHDNGVYGNIVSHTGGWPGYRTLMERHTQQDKTIIVLVNHINENTSFPLSDLRKILYDIEPLKFVELKEEDKIMFAGDYKNSSGKIVSLIYENGKLFRKMNDGELIELKAISKTKFLLTQNEPEVFYEFIIKNNKVEKYIATQPETKVQRELIRVE